MPYLDGIYRVKKAGFQEPSPMKIQRIFPWRKITLGLGIILILIFSGFLTTFAYPVIKKNVNLAKVLGNGRFLVLFQNNNELRPSGGFLGSFALVETEEGKIKNIYFETNIYKRDKAFTERITIEPPGALKTFCPEGKWQMRDSNWAIDFPEAAQKVAWFYEQEGGTTVDGVIALDTTFFEGILKILGPVEMPEYQTTITAENFFPEVQYKIEKEYFSDPANKLINEPKTILKDLLQKIFPRLQEKKYYFALGKLIYQSLAEKHLLLYFRDSQVQDYLLDKNWAGANVDYSQGDYLAINQANLGANKSSLEVKEEVRLRSQLKSNSLVNDLRIIRIHQGTGDWPSGSNRNYSRILVPKGSKILSASLEGSDILKDIDTFIEGDKTVFGFWFEVKSKASAILELNYEVPLKLSKDHYSLYWQKQPGTLGDELEVEVNDQKIFGGWVDRDIVIK